MRVLIDGENLSGYLAKCHEAFRTGLRGIIDTRFFGEGYDGYDSSITSYKQVLQKTFPGDKPDIIVSDFKTEQDFVEGNFNYQDRDYLHDLDIDIAVVMGDYWKIVPHRDLFVKNVLDKKIKFILSYFPQPLEIWKDTPIGDRFIYLPPSFDPKVFNDWRMDKTYDVGFLAAGTTVYSQFYPERYAIHHKIKELHDVKYLWANHPGWKKQYSQDDLVGQNFSKAINACKMFITTGGIYQNAHAKYFEILASKTLLLADEPIASQQIQLVDGYNYVKVTPENIIEKVKYYIENPQIAEKIAENGYYTAICHHTCYSRAIQFYQYIMESRNCISNIEGRI